MVQGDDEWRETLDGVAVAKADEEDLTFTDTPVPQLQDVLGAVDFDVWIDTNDWSKARVVVDGFRYLIRMEFQRQQPLLAVFYELEFTKPSLNRGGSHHYKDRVIVQLREEFKQTKDELEKLRIGFESLRNANERMQKERETLLKREVRARLTALWITMAPIITPITQVALERIFPPIQSQTEQQLQRDQAPMPVAIRLEYPAPDYERFPVDGFST